MSDPRSLLKRLKEQTDELHDQAHALSFFRALEEHALPIESYVGQLRSLAIILGALERGLKQSCPRFDSLIALGYRDKLPLLLDDLQFLGNEDVTENKQAIRAALDVADEIMLKGSSEPVALLGYLYTLEGSLMGGQVVRSALVEQFSLPKREGSSYLDCYGKEMGAYWRSFKTALEEIVTIDEQTALIDASNAMFQGLITLYEALYPLQKEAFVAHSSVLNPEAGEHLIPSDPDVLAAAIEASRECWYAFPYYELRYGERGYRFGLSDVAWLCTLSTLDQPLVNAQVDWLAKVLSNLGMPSTLLVHQLEILYDGLSRLSEEQKKGAERLLHSARHLQERSTLVLEVKKAEELAAQFERTSERDFSRRLRNSGTLLVSAVIDEHLGHNKAVSSLIVWLGDDTQFSVRWSDQVDDMITLTREAVVLAQAEEEAL